SDHATNNRHYGEFVGDAEHDQEFRYQCGRQREPRERGEQHASDAAGRGGVENAEIRGGQIFRKWYAAGEFEKLGPEPSLHDPCMPRDYGRKMSALIVRKHIGFAAAVRRFIMRLPDDLIIAGQSAPTQTPSPGRGEGGLWKLRFRLYCRLVRAVRAGWTAH